MKAKGTSINNTGLTTTDNPIFNNIGISSTDSDEELIAECYRYNSILNRFIRFIKKTINNR